MYSSHPEHKRHSTSTESILERIADSEFPIYLFWLGESSDPSTSNPEGVGHFPLLLFQSSSTNGNMIPDTVLQEILGQTQGPKQCHLSVSDNETTPGMVNRTFAIRLNFDHHQFLVLVRQQTTLNGWIDSQLTGEPRQENYLDYHKRDFLMAILLLIYALKVRSDPTEPIHDLLEQALQQTLRLQNDIQNPKPTLATVLE